LIKKIDDKDN
jgi:mitogen-activated protein kinase 1/3